MFSVRSDTCTKYSVVVLASMQCIAEERGGEGDTSGDEHHSPRIGADGRRVVGNAPNRRPSLRQQQQQLLKYQNPMFHKHQSDAENRVAR